MKQYRIRSERNIYGAEVYYPQEKLFFGWTNFSRQETIDYAFGTLEEAYKFLDEQAQRQEFKKHIEIYRYPKRENETI